MKPFFKIVLPLVLALSGASAFAQDDPKYVTRDEYEKLKKDLAELKAQQAGGQQKKKDDQELQQQIDELEKELKAVKEKAEAAKPGDTKFVITGYGFAGFTARQRAASTFSAGVSPILLWRLTDRILFESEVELGLDGNDTAINLEYADINYLLTDEITLRAGRFLAPFGTFSERMHPAWINKLPDFPLAFVEDGGISPFSVMGAEARGAVPLGETKLTYSVYVANSLRLITDDPKDAGKLAGDKFVDDAHRKIVGGRIGFYPIPELELGYSILYGRVGASATSFSNVDALLQAVDLGYIRDVDWIKGTITILGQWGWSHVERATYDPTGALGFGPATFTNRQAGGYLELAYRPSKMDVDVLKNIEIILRYDRFHKPPGAPDNVVETRWTLGLDYWITSALVFKVAYEWDRQTDPAGVARGANAFLAQWALGF
jgi:cell division protein FtsB